MHAPVCILSYLTCTRQNRCSLINGVHSKEAKMGNWWTILIFAFCTAGVYLIMSLQDFCRTQQWCARFVILEPPPPPHKNVIFLFFSSSLVHSGPDRGSPHSGTELFFATRTGTRLGIEAHLFRVETTKDLSLWTRHIVNGCHASAEMIKEVTTSKRWWKIT